MDYDLQEEKNVKRVEMLVKDVQMTFAQAMDLKTKLELVDSVKKLGLSNLFKKEMKEALENISSANNASGYSYQNLYTAALYFRLTRELHLHHVGLHGNNIYCQ